MDFLYTSILWICASLVFGSPTPKEYQTKIYGKHPAVERFREYLRIDTSREENIDYAVQFWRRQAEDLGLPIMVFEPAGKPICVITWEGTNLTLPSIMLNSHMDVVGVEEEFWSYPPFEAHLDENGDIYGRGTQDTKDISIQYIEAIRKLKAQNVTLQRTVHITLMPDEESGGYSGMIPFLQTEEFKAMNVGFALDEGLASKDNTLYATYQDRRPWQMRFTIKGEGGHGSAMPDGSAMEKSSNLIDVIMKYREEQKAIMKTKKPTDFGAYNSLNVNIVEGGIAPNVIPASVTVVVDMRLSTEAKPAELLQLVHSWMAVAGNGTKIEFLRREDVSVRTTYDTDPYWTAMQDAVSDFDVTIQPIVCPATSDMLYLRNHGIPAFGFAPKSNTISRIHGANEYLNVHTFLRGIDIYARIIEKLGNSL